MDKHELEQINRKINREIFIERYKTLILRWGIIALVSGLILVAGIMLYRAANPKPECVIDDQCQLGYLCNARAGRCEPEPEEQPGDEVQVEVSELSAVMTDTGYYDLGVLLKNSSPEWGLEEFEYVFTLTAADGNSRQITGTSYLLPREQRILTRSHEGYSGSNPQVDFEIINKKWKRIPGYSVSGLEQKSLTHRPAADGVGTYEVTVIFQNTGSYDLQSVAIAALLKGASGKVLGVNEMMVSGVKKQSQREVTLKWYVPFSGTPADVECSISANLYDPDNFLSSPAVPSATTDSEIPNF